MTSLNLASAGGVRALQKWTDEAPPRLAKQVEGPGLLASEAERRTLERSFSDLTNREREVLFALCDGGSNEQVAARLCIALPTLRTHLMRLHQKLGTSGKSELVGLAWQRLVAAYRRGDLPAGCREMGRSEN